MPKYTTDPIITCSEAQLLDQKTIDQHLIPASLLMEEAASEIFHQMQKDWPDLKQEKIAVIAGWGNNGGDALALIRKLYHMGCQVHLYLFEDRKGSQLYEMHKKIIQSYAIPVENISHMNLSNSCFSLIVEGIFGIGYHYREDPSMRAVFQQINQSGLPILSIDIPSGLTRQGHPCIQADHTYSIGLYKSIFYNIKTRKAAGRITNLPISFQLKTIKNEHAFFRIKSIEKTRPSVSPYVHKYSRGGALCLGGSRGKLGSILFSAQAALRCGSGISLVLTELENINTLNSRTDSVMFDEIKNYPAYLDKYQAFLIGPGLSLKNEQNINLIEKILQEEKQFILDASFFTLFKPENIKNMTKPPILTPHSQEFISFFKVDKDEIRENPLPIVQQAAMDYHCYILLKDSFCCLATPEGKVYVYDQPNPMAAQAGSGDLIAGIITGLSAQGMESLDCILQGLRIFYSIIDYLKEKSYHTYIHSQFLELIARF